MKHFAGSVRLYVDAEISLKLLAILAVLKRVQIGTRSADRRNSGDAERRSGMRDREGEKKVAQKLLDACVMLSRGSVIRSRPSGPGNLRPTSDSKVSESHRLRFDFSLKPLGIEAV